MLVKLLVSCGSVICRFANHKVPNSWRKTSRIAGHIGGTSNSNPSHQRTIPLQFPFMHTINTIKHLFFLTFLCE